MQSQQSLMLIKTSVYFLQIYHIQMVQVIYIIFWSEGLLTCYDSRQGLINKDLFSLRVIILRFGAIFRR